MEQGPQASYERDPANELPLQRTNSIERAPIRVEDAKVSPEANSISKSFEELVHDALEQELKFERDPALRNQAAERADQILAEFAESRATDQIEPNSREAKAPDKSKNHSASMSTTELMEQLGITNIPRKKRPSLSLLSSLNLSFVDLVMLLVITSLFVIVVILLASRA